MTRLEEALEKFFKIYPEENEKHRLLFSLRLGALQAVVLNTDEKKEEYEKILTRDIEQFVRLHDSS